jgi:hypothetical protein
MSHKRLKPHTDTYFRESAVAARQSGKGNEILCPFCIPTHPMKADTPSPCGSLLKVTAVQPVFKKPAVMRRELKCVKCGKGGGEMIMYMNGFVHLPDCTPEKRLLPSIPPSDRRARFVYRLKEGKLKEWLEKQWGKVQVVWDITDGGEKKGILSYFFLKGEVQ